jgi:mannosyltransferase
MVALSRAAHWPIDRCGYNGRVTEDHRGMRPDQLRATSKGLSFPFASGAPDRTGADLSVRLALAVGVILLAFGLRLWGLTATSLWYDETFVIHHARQGLVPAVTGLLRDDNAIPLHGLLVALWGHAAGWTEFTMRYLSVLLGTLTASLVYRLARAVSRGQTSGLGSALAYATLPIFVYYSQEVRMYALATPLAVGFAWAGWRLLTRRSSHDAVTYVLFGVLMLLAHLYTALVWCFTGLWGTVILLAHPSLASEHGLARVWGVLRRSSRWWMANLALALAAAPVVTWALWRARTDATAVSAIPFGVLRWVPLLFGVGQYLHAPWPLLFATASVLAILGALLVTARMRRWRALLWYALSLTLPLAFLYLTTLVKAKWSERYLLASWGVALILAVGNGWELLFARAEPARRRRWLQGAAAVLVMGFWLGPAFVALARQAEGSWAVAIRDEWHPRPDFRGVANYITAYGAPEDAVVVVGGYAASSLEFYYAGPAHVFGLPFATQILDTTRLVDLHALDTLERETQGRERLWLVLWQEHLADPTGLVQSVLVEQCRRLPVGASFTNVGVLLFDLTGCQPLNRLALPPVPLEVAFQAPVRLLGYDLLRTGPTWEVNLWWESTGRLDEDYMVFVHLLEPDGRLVAQHDHIAGADAYPTRAWQPGTRLRDRFFLNVPGEGCPGCVLRAGLYTETYRLPLLEGGDVVELAVP